jgi:hypothetical protein
MRTVPVYPLEVGAAVSFGLYLATMALVLAMHNPAFTELGTGGHERMDRRAESVRASIVRKKAYVARLRAEGRLPSEEGPPSRF